MITRILSLIILTSCWALGQTPTGPLSLHNAPLVDVVSILAAQAKINYIIDPRVKTTESVSTYGESQNLDARSLLDLILRINGAQMIRDGDVAKIVPLGEASSRSDQKALGLVFLKNLPPDEISSLLSQTATQATVLPYAPAGLLMILR